MIELGQHWAFILAAYLGCFGVVFALVGWTMFDAKRAQERLGALEAVRERQRAAKAP